MRNEKTTVSHSCNACGIGTCGGIGGAGVNGGNGTIGILGGVRVSNGSFAMNGGRIAGCTAVKDGNSYGSGGVRVDENSHFTMADGSIAGCTKEKVEPYVHLSIPALNNYMIFNECTLFLPQTEVAKKDW